MTRRRAAIASVAMLFILVTVRTAFVARAPDVIRKQLDYRGDAATTLAELLVLPAPGTFVFELSQQSEHRALPDRDAALREPDGMLSSELGWRTSTRIRATITWTAGALNIEGYVADAATAFPHGDGPQWSFASPGFRAGSPPPGWARVVASFMAFPAIVDAHGGETKRRSLRAGNERVVATLVKSPTYDHDNKPVDIWLATIAIGPWLAASAPSDLD